MATFSYLTASEALMDASPSAPEYRNIRGLRAMEAERLPGMTRTAAGYLRVPRDPWRAYAYTDKMRVIESVERAKDADHGMVEVFYADGSTELVDRYGLLCVERPV